MLLVVEVCASRLLLLLPVGRVELPMSTAYRFLVLPVSMLLPVVSVFWGNSRALSPLPRNALLSALWGNSRALSPLPRVWPWMLLPRRLARGDSRALSPLLESRVELPIPAGAWSNSQVPSPLTK
jgi:hypothetical protein